MARPRAVMEQPIGMSASQIVALAVLVVIIGVFAFGFFRQAPKSKRDNDPDSWSQWRDLGR